MSEPKLISPLLDHFLVGDAISNHDGVRCYPAMREDSDDKYILKIISVPASQVQLEALLLTGAYRDQASALAYFKELADGAVHEAETLQALSRLEGFAPYEGWQVVPMRDGVGYDVYLLGSYKRSLERYMRRHPMTQLSAVNLGLDMCAALTVCRRAGSLYVDLKPGNIFLSGNQTYQIGDLGLVSLSSLKYASLPDKYRSSYTPPEITDAYSALNATMDVYALGLILYQAYNNGELPYMDGNPFPTPMYADYEMSEIILKACAANPDDRWQDPAQMGQALVGYMQRNGVNDTPIIPVPEETEPESPAAEPPAEEVLPDESVPGEEAPVPSDPEPTAPAEPDVGLPEFMSEPDAVPVPDGDAGAEASDGLTVDAGDLSFIDELIFDETAPTDETALDLTDAVLSEELSQILEQADELIAHEAPEPAVAPDPIDVPMPEPIVPEPDEDDTEIGEDPLEVSEETPEVEEAVSAAEPAPKKKRSKAWIVILLLLLVFGAAAYGGYYYYGNIYLQRIADIHLDGFEDQLTVQLSTEIPDELLKVVCTDTYGISSSAAVSGGTAVFTSLNPATTYTVSVSIDGFHKLEGTVSATYTTASKTTLASFSAITGPTDGSVILSFAIAGPDAEEWTIACSAQGEAEKTVTFSGHSITVTDLTPDKEYTFRLLPGEDMYLDGNDTLLHTASRVIYAENLRFEALEDHDLTLAWDLPEGASAQTWTLTHYNQAGEILSMVTQEETSITMTLDDLTQSHTFELLAGGMTQSKKISLSANPITVSGVHTDTSNYPRMYLQWGYEGGNPMGGWLVTVRADGSEPLAVLACPDSTAELDALIPGAEYTLEFRAADDSTVFNDSYSFEVPEAEAFEDFWINGSNITMAVCRTPDLQEWSYEDLTADSFPDSFQVGEKASLSLSLNRSYALSAKTLTVVLVIRDADGLPVSADSYAVKWEDLFYQEGDGRYAELNIPTMPAQAGDYTIAVYFSGGYVGSADFTVS